MNGSFPVLLQRPSTAAKAFLCDGSLSWFSERRAVPQKFCGNVRLSLNPPRFSAARSTGLSSGVALGTAGGQDPVPQAPYPTLGLLRCVKEQHRAEAAARVVPAPFTGAMVPSEEV